MDKIATKEALSQIAIALNDKIAQQDYIRIEVASLDSQDGFTAEEKALIRKNLSNWPDVLLVDKDLPSNQSRIIAAHDEAIAWFDPANQTVVSTSITE